MERNKIITYKSVFEEIHAPRDLKGKVLAMNKNDKNWMNYIGKKVLAIAIAAGSIFAAGNGVCMAATGETIPAKVYSTIVKDKNGVEHEIQYRRATSNKGEKGYKAILDLPEQDEYFEIWIPEGAVE
ncbi:MAG: hypothetical protein IJF98_01580 [Firmicutes bacterium]|nr:hypothetical protein [Bacillota bacterium]